MKFDVWLKSDVEIWRWNLTLCWILTFGIWTFDSNKLSTFAFWSTVTTAVFSFSSPTKTSLPRFRIWNSPASFVACDTWSFHLTSRVLSFPSIHTRPCSSVEDLQDYPVHQRFQTETGIDEPVHASKKAFLVPPSLQIASAATFIDWFPCQSHCFCWTLCRTWDKPPTVSWLICVWIASSGWHFGLQISINWQPAVTECCSMKYWRRVTSLTKSGCDDASSN